MTRWGKGTGPRVGQVWERLSELWLIIEETRYGQVAWHFEAMNLMDGRIGFWKIESAAAQQPWKKFE